MILNNWEYFSVHFVLIRDNKSICETMNNWAPPSRWRFLLQIMSLCGVKKYHPALYQKLGGNMVPKVGLEPTRYRYQRILSPPRLPFHHFGTYYILYIETGEKSSFFSGFEKFHRSSSEPASRRISASVSGVPEVRYSTVPGASSEHSPPVSSSDFSRIAVP